MMKWFITTGLTIGWVGNLLEEDYLLSVVFFIFLVGFLLVERETFLPKEKDYDK